MSKDSQVSAILEQAKALNADQLSELVKLLMQRLTDDPNYYPDWHRREVELAIAEHEANPDGAMSADESLAWVRNELKRRQAKRA